MKCAVHQVQVKLTFRTIVVFPKKVYILVRRENITLKRRALPNILRYHKWDWLPKKNNRKQTVFPLACWKEGMSSMVFTNAVLNSDDNGKEE